VTSIKNAAAQHKLTQTPKHAMEERSHRRSGEGGETGGGLDTFAPRTGTHQKRKERPEDTKAKRVERLKRVKGRTMPFPVDETISPGGYHPPHPMYSGNVVL